MGMDRIKKCGRFLRERGINSPKIGIILGSGLGKFADGIGEKIEVEYGEIPEFPISTAIGHEGKFVYGKLFNKDVIVMKGRVHFYEGYSIEDVVLPVRVMIYLGIKILIITNSSGAINKSLKPGDLVLIRDHINFMGINPLRGKNYEEFGPRFPDMTYVYDLDLRKLAMEVAKERGIDLREGIYAAMSGPSYETPAEINMLHILGADVVGMSTVPEAIVASHAGLKVLGISCAANMAAGILKKRLSEEEVIEVADSISDKFEKLLNGIVERI